MLLTPERTVAPTSEPITLDQAKLHLNIAEDDSTYNSEIEDLIQAAREQWEHDTDSVLCYQTWRIRVQSLVDRFPLPKRPVDAITSITYYDGNNASQTLSSSLYQLHVNEFRLAYQSTLPATSARWDAWTINYRCGYSQDATLVPAIAKRAMMLLVGHYFENRDMLMSDALQTMKPYEALVTRFMRSNYP